MVFMRSILGYIAAAFCVVVWGGTFVNTSELQVRTSGESVPFYDRLTLSF